MDSISRGIGSRSRGKTPARRGKHFEPRMVSSLPSPRERAISQGQQQRGQAKKPSNSPQHYFTPIRKDPPNESVAPFRLQCEPTVGQVGSARFGSSVAADTSALALASVPAAPAVPAHSG